MNCFNRSHHNSSLFPLILGIALFFSGIFVLGFRISNFMIILIVIGIILFSFKSNMVKKPYNMRQGQSQQNYTRRSNYYQNDTNLAITQYCIECGSGLKQLQKFCTECGTLT